MHATVQNEGGLWYAVLVSSAAHKWARDNHGPHWERRIEAPREWCEALVEAIEHDCSGYIPGD